MKYAFVGYRGQSLLILVLIIAMVLAVVSATSYRLSVDTKTTKLQEETVRAMAAADAGIDIGLQRATRNTTNLIDLVTFQDVGLNPEGIDPARSSIQVTQTSPTLFTTPRISLGQQYTFYLKDPNAAPTTSDWDGFLVMRFRNDDGGTQCISPRNFTAFEITFIHRATTGGDTIYRELVDPCTTGEVIGTALNRNNGAVSIGNTTVDGVTYFALWAGFDLMISMPHLRAIVVRPLFAAGSVRFEASWEPFISQGKTIQSTAVSRSGASRRITVFQSLPQIPAEFFVTQF